MGRGATTVLAALVIVVPLFAFAANSQSYTSAGSHTFTVPAYTTLTVEVWGAGGGGAGELSKDGANGGKSSFGSVVGQGGKGGNAPGVGHTPTGFGGAGGTASGGTTNTSGGDGKNGSNSSGGKGGSSPNGGAGGSGGSGSKGSAGKAPGGGGGGGGGAAYSRGGGGGGGGGYSKRTYTSGQLAPGATITVVVGAGGAGGKEPSCNACSGGNGAKGEVDISWTSTAPTCSVTFGQNPIPYGGTTTLNWTSANATSMYINSVGYVTPNVAGSTTIGPSSSTDYSCSVSGSGGTGSQSATLSVTAPAAPTVGITADSTSIPVGSSTVVRATFNAGSGDSLTGDNIDSPVGTGLGATTNPDATKTYTFMPSSAGTYTFYARAQTSYYTSWATYGSVGVTVASAPACTVTFDQNPIAQGASTGIHWTSSNATAFSIAQIGSVTPNTSGSATVSPSQPTNYTGTVSAAGVVNTCPATLGVSCTPAYSCSGDTIQYTNSSCSVSNVATCVAPGFCSAGSSSCLYPAPSFIQSGQLTGHLQVNPQILHAGTAATVTWNVDNVSGCTVIGDNGDSWSGTSGSKTSKPIVQQTVYNLHCDGLDGSSVDESATTNVLPSFQER